jgi:tetratricopeptide (TPR) repeat protein
MQRILAGDDTSETPEARRARAEEAVAEGDRRIAGGDLVGAEASYQQAIDLVPGHAGGYAGRGQVRLLQGALQAALADADRAVLLDAESAVAYQTRGIAKAQLDDPAGAELDFGEAIRIDPEFNGAFAGRAQVRLVQGKLSGALADVEEALKLFGPDTPQHATMRDMRAQILVAMGDPREE